MNEMPLTSNNGGSLIEEGDLKSVGLVDRLKDKIGQRGRLEDEVVEQLVDEQEGVDRVVATLLVD